MKNKLILASSSPRRREILSLAGYCFDVASSSAEELSPGVLPPEQTVVQNALAKAADIAFRPENRGRTVIGADTLVFSAGKTLGKPHNEAEAAEMLSALSGKTHTVFTGYAVITGGEAESGYCRTEVKFRELTRAEIERYVRTGEPMDKAGAYGIQGYGCVLVESVCGDYFNVMGLPVSTLYGILENRGIFPLCPADGD